MMQLNDDLRYVFRGLRVPALTAVSALLLLTLSAIYQARIDDKHRSMVLDQGTVNTEYEAFVLRKRVVEHYHRRYEVFRTRGFVANEKRLDWIETLREAGEDIGLPRLSFTLQPQEAVVPPAFAAGSDIGIRASSLNIELGLLHEVDLLRLLDSLRAYAPGLVSVDRCELARQSGGAMLSAADANIAASCSLRLYSVTTADVEGADRKVAAL